MLRTKMRVILEYLRRLPPSKVLPLYVPNPDFQLVIQNIDLRESILGSASISKGKESREYTC
jgi:hypothetical protein